MHEWVVTAGLTLILIMASLASVGWDMFEMRNRESWWWTCILMMEVLLMPNVWMACVLAMVVIGLFQIGRSWFILRTLVIPVAGLAGAYIAIAPLMRPWMIAPVLWAGVFVGMALGAWGILGWWVGKPFQYHLPKSWFGFWGVYEHSPDHPTLCGHGNPMHLLSISSLSVACVVGLLVLGSWWAALAGPVCLVPLLLCQKHGNGHPHQGHLFMLVLAVGALTVYRPLLGLSVATLLLLTGLGLLVRVKPWNRGMGWWDSGRTAYWKDAVQLVWWPEGWRKRLFGFGTSTWFLATVMMGEKRGHGEVFTTAHNDYLQQMVEHGLIGLFALCVYLADALWRTAHGGPEGQAVFVVGLVWCSVAMVNFPTALFHEYHPSTVKEEHWFGSPTLNAWSFVLALLAEAF